MCDKPLFSTYDLSAHLRSGTESMQQTLATMDADRVLTNSVSAVVEYLLSQTRIAPIQIQLDDIRVSQEPRQVDVSRDQNRFIRDRSRPFHIEGTRYAYFVPFLGDPDLLQCRASAFTLSPPHANVRGQVLEFVYDMTGQPAAEVKARFDRDLSSLQQHVGWINTDLDPFNAGLEGSATQLVEARRAKLLADRNAVAELGYPIVESKGNGTYTLPTQRVSRPKPGLPAAKGPFKPEPALSNEDYEHILSVIQQAVRTIERSPASFATMGEENLRDLILVMLNSHYAGSATGETFNADGKTDILIREQDRNVFIAECKIWKGASALAEALDQLLGYLAWRDTKTALIVFNRNRDLTKVLEQIQPTVEGHPNHLRTLSRQDETSFAFALRHRDDTQKELLLTVLVFDVPQGASA